MSFIIGAEIKKHVRKKGLKNKAFADLMNMEERNLYHFFKKEQLEVDQLLDASKVLDFDFLKLYIENSKYKSYLKNNVQNYFNDSTVKEVGTEYEKNQISFSINIKGSFDKVTSEMSNFLQSVKKEAEKHGLHLV